MCISETTSRSIYTLCVHVPEYIQKPTTHTETDNIYRNRQHIQKPTTHTETDNTYSNRTRRTVNACFDLMRPKLKKINLK